MFRSLVLITVLSAASSVGIAHGDTAKEQAACHSDVRRFCHTVVGQGDFAILACLQEHREKLRHACREVLESHGQ